MYLAPIDDFYFSGTQDNSKHQRHRMAKYARANRDISPSDTHEGVKSGCCGSIVALNCEFIDVLTTIS